MIIILGLIVLVAAVIAGAAGVLGNAGAGHALTHPFAVLGYHLAGSTGTLFLFGMVIGAAGMIGLSVLLAGARRTSRRGRQARQGLRQSRRETAAVSQHRDDLLDQREAAVAGTAPASADGSRNGSPQQSPGDGRSWRQRLLGQRAAPSPEAGRPSAETLPAQTALSADTPTADTRADASVSAD
jgi:hypothetical protein